MRSISSGAVSALLAGLTVAQPHGHHGHQHHHAKRELVTEWETVWETVTVLVDESTTRTILPVHTTEVELAAGQFYQSPATTTTTTTSTPAPKPVIVETPSVVEKPPPAPTPIQEEPSQPPPPPPAPTTTPEPAPAPAPVTTTKVEPKPVHPVQSSNSGGGGGGGKVHSGEITHYTLGIGACGYDDLGKDNSDPIVAVSKADWLAISSLTNLGLNQPSHPWCDKSITITADNGKSTTAVIRDVCPGCESGSIDVSEVVFKYLYGDLGVGRAKMSWSFN